MLHPPANRRIVLRRRRRGGRPPLAAMAPGGAQFCVAHGVAQFSVFYRVARREGVILATCAPWETSLLPLESRLPTLLKKLSSRILGAIGLYRRRIWEGMLLNHSPKHTCLLIPNSNHTTYLYNTEITKKNTDRKMNSHTQRIATSLQTAPATHCACTHMPRLAQPP